MNDCHGKTECLIPAFEEVAGSGAFEALLNLTLATWYVWFLFLGLISILLIVKSASTGKGNPIAMIGLFFRVIALITFVAVVIGN